MISAILFLAGSGLSLVLAIAVARWAADVLSAFERTAAAAERMADDLAELETLRDETRNLLTEVCLELRAIGHTVEKGT